MGLYIIGLLYVYESMVLQCECYYARSVMPCVLCISYMHVLTVMDASSVFQYMCTCIDDSICFPVQGVCKHWTGMDWTGILEWNFNPFCYNYVCDYNATIFCYACKSGA